MDFTFSPWLIWFLAGIVVMLAELAAPGFIILFFGLGCWGAALVAVFFPHAYTAQVAVFLFVSIASLITLRKMAMSVFVGKSEDQKAINSGNIPIGARIILDTDLEAGRTGRVRFRGGMWDAISEEHIPAGAQVEIIGVENENRSCLRLKSTR